MIMELSDSSNSEGYWDHVNGGWLDPVRVRAARKLELEYIKKMEVYKKVPHNRAMERTGKKPIQVRWIDTDKGMGGYRSRLVAKEFRTDARMDLFSATPPLELVKLLVAMVATAQKDRGSWDIAEPARGFTTGDHSRNEECNPICFLYTDISRAYFHAPAKEEKVR